MAEQIFVDTLFVVALVNRRDQYHPQAVALAEDKRAKKRKYG